MAATKPACEPRSALASLTLAAIALPGLAMQPASAAEGDSASVIYEHYSEGKRDLAGLSSNFQPIEVDTILGNLNFTLPNNLKGTLTLTQDTWSGATPVATAPLSARGNRINTTHTHVTTGASIDDSGHIHDPESGEAASEGLPHSLSGASPYLYSALKLDAERRPLMTDSDGKVMVGAGGIDSTLVHTLSSASPEVRQQFDLSLSRELKNATLNVGGGLSQERDFDSLFGHVSGSWDFNSKLTTLNAGLSYSHNNTHALLDHDVVPHVYEPYMLAYEQRGSDIYNRTFSSSQLNLKGTSVNLKGERDDWGLNLGATQVINQGALLTADLAITHSSGYQSNPYKAVEVAFIDPLKQQGTAGGNALANYTYDAELVALLEQRPDVRDYASLNLKYIQHIQATDAALHTGYRYFQDNWGIAAHSVDFEWIQPLAKRWTLAPHLRYYSQSQADFYTPYLITDQGLYTTAANTQQTVPFDRAKLPRHYSSDARLSAYGTLTAGIALSKTLRDGMNIDFSYEHMRHAGKLKLGSKGEAPYADFDSYLFNIGLNIDLGEKRLSAIQSSAFDQDDGDHSQHAHHHAAHQSPHQSVGAPAGVQFDHLLENAGDLMFGYRLMAMQQGGDIARQGDAQSDYALINNACYGKPCYVRPTHMTMRMHMLDMMYAPTDWLTLMLMPQFVDMSMGMRLLDDSPRSGGMDAIGMAITHAQQGHTTSGLGDTEIHGLIQLFKQENAELHIGLGVSAPTADVSLKMRPMMGIDMGLLEYGMQLGSGTWDFKPSITLTGHNSVLTTQLAWGAQVSATQRLEDKNASGYALGDIVQSTLWGSYALNRSLSVSLRGLYTDQDTIKDSFNNTHIAIAAGDYTQNYGGRFADVGLGVSGNIETGSLAGTRWGLEWLQPLADKPNGYQLRRKGALVFNWAIHL